MLFYRFLPVRKYNQLYNQRADLSKVLIANRGEIACRIIRSANKLGITPITIYNEADKNSLHVKLSRHSYFLGGPEAKTTYLSVDKIIDVAIKSGADCLHPGYGFLSESAELAQKCLENNITWIGPSSETIRSIGIKSNAKRIMQKAGVPVLQGYHGSMKDLAYLKDMAKKIGFPVMIKPVSGGGGKGMRVAYREEDFESMAESSSREAKRSFVVDEILIEKFIKDPRHIEIQIIGDNYGNILHLYERDCSLQRRHQKIIEEAPAACLSDQLRKLLGETAVAVGQAVSYTNAGTVEFILDKDVNFYFMEMNTRLQVEHPITEMITGCDLVDMQFKVASGEKLDLCQSDIRVNGHAFEARIYAEDPSNNFLPCTGIIKELKTPPESQNIRIDKGVTKGSMITPYFDPMIAKLIVKGSDRSSALKLLHASLNNFYISGFPTNISFLKKILEHEDFKNNKINTSFIEVNSGVLNVYKVTASRDEKAAAILGYYLGGRRQEGSSFSFFPFFRLNNIPSSTVCMHDSDRNIHIYEVEWIYDSDEPEIILKNGESQDEFFYSIDEDKITIKTKDALSSATTFSYTLTENGIDLFTDSGVLSMQFFDQNFENDSESNTIIEKSIKSPMNGTVIKINCKIGDEIRKGMPLLTIEAMKMEHTLVALSDYVIQSINCLEGETVRKDKVLIEI